MARPRAIGILLAAVTAILPLAPPEHVHEVEEQGYHHLLVHRHADTHAVAYDFHHHDGVFDHEEERATTLEARFVAPAVVILAAPVASSVVIIEPPQVSPGLRTPEYVERVIHGPPRAPAGLRAPPAVSRL